MVSPLLLVLKEPEKVLNLTIDERTTSSLSLTWIRPPGRSAWFSVTLTSITGYENATTNATSYNFTGLDPGTEHDVSVSAVAADNYTEGETSTVSAFTRKCDCLRVLPFMLIVVSLQAKEAFTSEVFVYPLLPDPAVVEGLTVTYVTTTSMSLSWLKPKVGDVESYLVRWNHHEATVDDSSVSIPDLIPGTLYNISVAATVQNGTLRGESALVSNFTSRLSKSTVVH